MPVEVAHYVKFTCPNCEKPIGFPRAQAGYPALCPKCLVRIMIPERGGETSFIVAAPAPSSRRTPIAHARPSASSIRPNRSLTLLLQEVLKRTPWWRTALISASCLVVLVMAAVIISGWLKKDETARTQTLPAPSPKNEKPDTPSDGKPASSKQPAVEPVLEVVEPAVPNKSAPATETTTAPAKKNKPEHIVIGTRDGSDSVWSRPQPKELFNLDAEKRPSNRAGEDEEPVAETPALTSSFPPDQPKAEVSEEEKQEDPVLSLIKEKVKEEQAAEARKARPAHAPDRKNLAPEIARPMGVQPPMGPARVEPPTVCMTCQGTSVRPLPRYAPYVWEYTKRAPAAIAAVPHVPCSTCQPKADPKALVARETERMRTAPTDAGKWSQKLNARMACGETRYVSVLSQLSPTSSRGVLRQLDKLTQFLQQYFRSALLTQTRPHTHRLLIAWDKATYERMIDVAAADKSDQDRELPKKCSGFISRYQCVFNVQGRSGSLPQHLAVFQVAHMLIKEATAGKSPDWLTAGFASYCEKKMLGANRCSLCRYEFNRVQLGSNWNAAVSLYVRRGKLVKWDRVFQIDLIDVKALEYLTCYSMVGYLASEPERFNTLLVNIRGGMDSKSALEHAYDRKIEELQMTWAMWAVLQR